MVGANYELKKCLERFNKNEIVTKLAIKEIKYKLNPLYGSHFFAIWQQLIQIANMWSCLFLDIKTLSLDFFDTILTRIYVKLQTSDKHCYHRKLGATQPEYNPTSFQQPTTGNFWRSTNNPLTQPHLPITTKRKFTNTVEANKIEHRRTTVTKRGRCSDLERSVAPRNMSFGTFHSRASFETNFVTCQYELVQQSWKLFDKKEP